MFCYNCGHKLEDGVRFCEKCGIPVAVSSPVEETPAEEMNPAAEESAAQQVPPTGQYNPPQYAAPAAEDGSKVFSILSLVLGIFSVLFFWVPILMFVPEILSALFGIIGLIKRSGKGMALAGLILAIVSFALTALVSLVIVVLFLSEGMTFDPSFYFGY